MVKKLAMCQLVLMRAYTPHLNVRSFFMQISNQFLKRKIFD